MRKITIKNDLGKTYRFKEDYRDKAKKGTLVILVGTWHKRLDFLLYGNESGGFAGFLFSPKIAPELLEEVEPITFYRKVKKGAKK